MWPLIGNDRIISFLQRSLEKGVLSQAYLFTGLPRVGKMTLALLIAQAVNCTVQNKPCGDCTSCTHVPEK